MLNSLYMINNSGNNVPYPTLDGSENTIGAASSSSSSFSTAGNIGSLLGGIASVASTINSIYGGHKTRKLAREQLKLNKEQIERENRLEDEDRATLKTAQDKMAKASDNFNYLERS